jgi:hypothetical protein
MRRPRPIPFAAVLLLAVASGCASLAPEPPPPAPAPAAAAAAAPETSVVDDAAPAPKAAASPAGTTRPAAPRTAARSAASAASAKSGASSDSRARAPVTSPEGGAGAAAARSATPASDPSVGPSVTTFVFSDAPAPVRREATRGEAAPAPNAARTPEGFNPYRIAYAPGTYRCELGRSVQVRTVAADQRSTVLRWGEGDYTLRSVDARSGALRYEDPAAGLAWIVLKDRAMLLDTRAGQRLANACRAQATGGRDGA